MAGNLIISNGHVIDIDNGVNQTADLFIKNGRIAHVVHSSTKSSSRSSCSQSHPQVAHSFIGLSSSPSDTADNETDATTTRSTAIASTTNGMACSSSSSSSSSTNTTSSSSSSKVFDASNCYVAPGLIDCHLHAYQYATPLGLDVDDRCLSRGVTSVVDAGSAGSTTFMGLRKLIAEKCQTRIFAFLHIAQHGLAAAACAGLGIGGECDSLNVVDVRSCCDVINDNRDMVVGIKLRLASSITNEGKNEQECLRRSLEASQLSQVPLMVHHSLSTVTHEERNGSLGCPGSLRKGDIYTHCFHGHSPSLLDPETGKVRKSCWEARERGVLFDVGHGQGSFSWRVAEQCVAEGFWPDTISTDLHTESQEGPAYDLMCIMTKMLHLGIPVKDVIAAVTSKPAAAIGKEGEIGSLGVGRRADVTVFRVVNLDNPIPLEDSFGETRDITQAFQPVAVFLDGEQFPVFADRPWPNPRIVAECRARASKYRN